MQSTAYEGAELEVHRNRGAFYAIWVGASVLIGACGGDGPGAAGDAAVADAAPTGQEAADAAPTGQEAADAAPGDWQELIGREWSLPSASEVYRCVRTTLQEDVYIAGFRSLSPPGTHHTVLSVTEAPSAPDGSYDCTAEDLDHAMLFASGVGTGDLAFPAGVAVKVKAGQQLALNLHLYNASDDSLMGRSGTMVRVLAASEVEQEAEVVFGGTFEFELEPYMRGEASGSCRFAEDATVVALWPHMHQLGRHMTISHLRSDGEVTLLDRDYDFNEQVNYVIDPVEIKAGEGLKVECTYQNYTGRTVIFGDSSNDEMCFAGIYRYPATGAGLFDCVEGG